MITGFSHVSIVVPDIEAAARMLAEKFGLAVGERMVNEQQGVRLAYIELAPPDNAFVAEVMVVTVLVSVLVHGASVVPLATWYGRRGKAREADTLDSSPRESS